MQTVIDLPAFAEASTQTKDKRKGSHHPCLSQASTLNRKISDYLLVQYGVGKILAKRYLPTSPATIPLPIRRDRGGSQGRTTSTHHGNEFNRMKNEKEVLVRSSDEGLVD